MQWVISSMVLQAGVTVMTTKIELQPSPTIDLKIP